MNGHPKLNRRNFFKLGSAGALSKVIPETVAFGLAQGTAIRLALMARATPLASKAWYAIVDEAIELSASYPKTQGALFRLFMKWH